MSFEFSEEQRLLAESADRFVQNEYDIDRRREIVASDNGFDAGNWRQLAELGWLAIPFAEEDGGLGWGMADVAVLMESLGRGIVVEPYLATVLLGGGLVAEAGSTGQRQEILEPLIAGGLQLAFAHSEPRSRFNLSAVETKAEKSGGGYVISGAKAVVFNGAAADKLVVSARTGGGPRDRDGISLFLVDGDADGISRRGYGTVDGGRAAEITLSGVSVPADAMLGAEGAAAGAIEAVTDKAIVAVCAEAAGIMEACLRQTNEYIKTRKQFGVPIGKFQVLQHRMADMFQAHQLSRAMTYRAATVVDGDDAAERTRAASAAKVRCGDAGRLIGQEAIQMHGGMGMTDEMAIGHYFKRLTMIDTLFGDRHHHVRKFARAA